MTMSILHCAAVLSAMCALGSMASGQLIIGHRGASHDAPEKRLAAYKLAIEQGADGFEGDYWLGAGGHVMCLHDADTKRVAGKKLSVTKAPVRGTSRAGYRQLEGSEVSRRKDSDVGGMLSTQFPPARKFFVELKSGPEVVGPMAKVIAKSNVSPDQIVFISFHDGCDRRVQETDAAHQGAVAVRLYRRRRMARSRRPSRKWLPRSSGSTPTASVRKPCPNTSTRPSSSA